MKTHASPASNKRQTGGFSLAEVAISLAVAGIALMSVVGLIPGLLDSEQASGANTAITAFATQALGDARAKSYGDAYESAPQNYTIYFGQDGNLTTSPSGAAYACKVTQTPITPDTSGNVATPGTHCRMVTMEFTWPVNATVITNRNRKIVYATLPES